ncbi:hypothetical protein [Prosthecobacter sp.]|uniref:hypothetical protein n=1 Tax=Prosthecobacter sp. TaxID=1965333 RepID=UPI0037830A69
MHRTLLLSALILASCADMMNSHRMMAAERKMLETRKLQQAGRWDDALAMAERMHGSVARTIQSAPSQKSAQGGRIDVTPLLAAWEKGPFAELKTALQKRDATRSAAAFQSLRQQCVNCHAVLGKQHIRLAEIP